MDKVNQTIADVKGQHLMPKYEKIAADAMENDGNFFSKYGTFFVTGLKSTILVSIIGVVLGAALGAVIALMKISSIKPLKWIASFTLSFYGEPLYLYKYF